MFLYCRSVWILFLEAFFSRFAEFVDAASTGGAGASGLHGISGSTGAVPGWDFKYLTKLYLCYTISITFSVAWLWKISKISLINLLRSLTIIDES